MKQTKLQKELKTKVNDIILTEDDIVDAACYGEMDIRNDILNEAMPDLPEDAEWEDLDSINFDYTVKNPLLLKGRIFTKGEDIYKVYPNRYSPLEMLVYKNGLFEKTVPASVDWEVTSKNVDAQPVYREVWSPKTLAGPGEPISEEFDHNRYVGNIEVNILGVSAPDPTAE